MAYDEVRLADVSSFIARGITPSYTETDGIWVINQKCIRNGQLSLKEARLHNAEKKKVSADKLVRRMDILVNSTGVGTLGRVAQVTDEINATVDSHVTIVRPSEEIDPRFLGYAVKWKQPYIEALAEGSTGQTELSRHRLGDEITIPRPSLNEQKRIADLLCAIDNKIITNRKIADNLQQQAQALYHERFECVSFDALPSGWRVVQLGDVATICNKSFNPLKSPEILLEHYSIPAFDDTKFPAFEPSTSIKSNKFIIDNNCFLISKLNPTTKRVWRPYCLTENAVCSTEFIVYKAKEKFMTDYLYSVIDSTSFSDFMCSHVTGSTGSRQRTTPSDTLSFELVLPSEDELTAFQSIVSPMYAQIKICSIENDKLKLLRDSLLPKLMAGEIDVSDQQP